MTPTDPYGPMAAAVERAIGPVADDLAAGFDRLPPPPGDRDSFVERFRAVNDPAEDRLRRALGAIDPDARWADEFDDELPANGSFWVADAIDGAVQYVQRLPHWCTSACLVRDGRAVLAVVCAPTRRVTFRATLGGGSFANGRPIRASARSTLDAAVTATSHPPFVHRRPDVAAAIGASLTRALLHVPVVRNLGPTALQIADVAGGSLDAFWMVGHDPANLVAGALVAAEAGAVVSDLDGAAWTPASASFVAAAPGIHRPLVAALSPENGPRTTDRCAPPSSPTPSVVRAPWASR